MSDLLPVAKILNRMAGRAVELGRQLQSESDLVASILTRLPQIGGCISVGDADRAGALIESLIREINRLISRSPDHSDFVTHMMADLNELGLIGQIWGRPDSQSDPEPPAPPPKKRDGEGVTYVKRKGRDGQVVLAESRPGSDGRDFYVGKTEYDRAAKAVATAAVDDWVKFPVIFEAYKQLAGGAKASAYPVRVLLRFWRIRHQPLVERERSRYRVVGSASKFRKAVKAAWDELAEV